MTKKIVIPEKKDAMCTSCPCKLANNAPSQHALEKIHAMQALNSATKREKRSEIKIEDLPGCDYYINSSNHNYCFWVYAASLSHPLPDREICQLLGINMQQLKQTYDSAISKLQNNTNNNHMKEFIELIAEKAQMETGSYSVYVQDDVADGLLKPEGELDPPEPPIQTKRKKLNSTGQPKHRDGKKVDLYNLTTKKKTNAKKNKH